jgi:hypothetical protein
MSNQEECIVKFNNVMHGLLGYDEEASWVNLDDSIITLAQSAASNFLKSWPDNFIAKRWLEKITEFHKRVGRNKQVEEKRPSVFSASPIEAAFARQVKNAEKRSLMLADKNRENNEDDDTKILGDDDELNIDCDVDDIDDDEGFDNLGSDDECVDDEKSAEKQKKSDEPDAKTRKRALQHVSTLDARELVVKWMIDEAKISGDKGIISRAVKNFPQHFRGNYKANVQKASR